MASRLELITMRDVYKEIIADLGNIPESELESKYKEKLKEIEARLINLRRD